MVKVVAALAASTMVALVVRDAGYVTPSAHEGVFVDGLGHAGQVGEVVPAGGPPGTVPLSQGLEAPLQGALEAAAVRAAQDGVVLTITSGFRSAQEQQALWESAVAGYGSEREARRWVLPPTESSHVRGRAVDVDPATGDWLVVHGPAWGLCRVYANEWWHFELVGEPGRPCPPMVADASVPRHG